MEIRILRDIEDLHKLQDSWFELAESLGSAGITQYPEYTLSCAKAFNSVRKELITIAGFFEDRLVAIFPVRLVRRKLFGINARVIEFPEYPVPVRDVLVSPDVSPTQVLDSIILKFQSMAGDQWDYMCFRGVLESSTLVSLAKHYRRSSTVNYDFSHLLPVETDDYVTSVLKSKIRNNLRRNKKKLAGCGEYTFRTFDSFPELEFAYQAFLDTEAAGWKSIRGGKRAVALHKDQKAFYLDLLRRNSKRGRSHIHLLYLDNQPIASDLCILTSEACYSLKHGYDENYSDFAPGNLLREYTLGYYGRSEQIKSIDLVSGMKWHLLWQPKRRKVFEVRFFNKSLRGSLLWLLYRAKRWLKRSSVRT